MAELKIELPFRDEIVIPGTVMERLEGAEIPAWRGLEGEPRVITRELVTKLLSGPNGGARIDLGRGSPQFTNTLATRLARQKYWDQYPDGYPTYKGPKIDGDQNAFRGAAPYLSHVVDDLHATFGLEVNPRQLLTSHSAQRLVTFLLEYYLTDEGREVGTTDLTFDRSLRFLRRKRGRRITSFLHTEHGHSGAFVDLHEIGRFFKAGAKKVLFLVETGNPTGLNFKAAELKVMCDFAQENDGKILLDCAYARLFFKEEDKIQMGTLQPYIDNGTLTLVFSSTKEGGPRGCAYAVGRKDEMTQLLKVRSDEDLSPDYDQQMIQTKLEQLSDEEAEKVNGKSHLDFLRSEIRPALAASFGVVRRIVVENGEIPLTHQAVQGGYNVSVLLPETSGNEKEGDFFNTLKGMGVTSENLNNFAVEKVQSGFRIPFGGFSPAQLTVICHVIVEAYERTFE